MKGLKESRKTHGLGQRTWKGGVTIPGAGTDQDGRSLGSTGTCPSRLLSFLPPFSCPSPPHASLCSVWLGGPYLLVPALDQADETLHLGGTLLEEGSLQLREAGGELTSSPQALALLDEPDVDLGVRSVVAGQLTCSGRIHSLQMSALL